MPLIKLVICVDESTSTPLDSTRQERIRSYNAIGFSAYSVPRNVIAFNDKLPQLERSVL